MLLQGAPAPAEEKIIDPPERSLTWLGLAEIIAPTVGAEHLGEILIQGGDIEHILSMIKVADDARVQSVDAIVSRLTSQVIRFPIDDEEAVTDACQFGQTLAMRKRQVDGPDEQADRMIFT